MSRVEMIKEYKRINENIKNGLYRMTIENIKKTELIFLARQFERQFNESIESYL